MELSGSQCEIYKRLFGQAITYSFNKSLFIGGGDLPETSDASVGKTVTKAVAVLKNVVVEVPSMLEVVVVTTVVVGVGVVEVNMVAMLEEVGAAVENVSATDVVEGCCSAAMANFKLPIPAAED